MDKLLSKIRNKVNLKSTIPGLALGMLTACTPSQEEIKQMISMVPQEQQHTLVINYDKQLLNNIDSLVESGTDIEKAVEKAHTITWEQACKMMPKQSEWTGKEYVVEQEAEKQLDNSRETKHRTIMLPRPIYMGKSTSIAMQPVLQTYHEYHPEYRDSLEKEIQAKESAQAKIKENSNIDVATLKQMQQQKDM